MNKTQHKVYISSMVLFVGAITFYIAKTGFSYYNLPIEERFYHPNYNWFKPSGLFGQGLGVIGTFLIAFGVTIYILRKRYGLLERFIRLKYLLEFHIFLCTLGPILILFHTTFKFGGIVSIAFWSMVAVVLSGVIGRFIYIQIPRTIEGRALSIEEVKGRRKDFNERIEALSKENLDDLSAILKSSDENKWGLKTYFVNIGRRSQISKILKSSSLSKSAQNEIIDLVREEMSLSSKIQRLEKMQQLFKYWHVIHMPFAIIMLIIVIIHVVITVSLGYKWIF